MMRIMTRIKTKVMTMIKTKIMTRIKTKVTMIEGVCIVIIIIITSPNEKLRSSDTLFFAAILTEMCVCGEMK